MPAILERRLGRELTVTVVDEPDGRVRLDLVSTFNGGAAYARPLNVLRAEGVRVQGLERLDLVDDVDADELGRLVSAYDVKGYDETLRRRVAALTGEPIVRRAIEARRRVKRRFGWDAVMASAAHSTPGVEDLLLQAAITEPDLSLASLLVGLVAARGTMAELVSERFEPSVEAVLNLARRPQPVASDAFRVAAVLPTPLPHELAAVLCRAARSGGLTADDAVRALRRAEPTPEVRAAIEVALESTIADVSDAAISTLGRLFGTGARPYWQAWLASTSAPRRMSAEEAIGTFGDAEDVPLAAEHLRKIIRRRSSISWQPPRGNEIITLLVRHRDLPAAEAALADLMGRWPKLPEELQAWLRRYHRDLAPPEDSSVPSEVSTPPPPPSEGREEPAEPPLEWPVPSIEREGKEFRLGFWDTDLNDIRDRFEDLAAADPAITIIDGDREWGTYRIDVADPESLIAALWMQAHEPPAAS
ncbi:MAG: hypothetical protein L0227_05405 [Chloroflexi bacterium]|nr:hypothetical protein [Chloroflexota bacterium]